MKLLTLEKAKDLMYEKPLEKHLKEFSDHNYPEVMYGCWIKGIVDYLRWRKIRTKGGNNDE